MATKAGSSKFADISERGFERLLGAYNRSLQVVLKHRQATMAAFAVVLVSTAVLFIVVPKGFIPEQDTDQISVTTEAAQGTAYDKLVEYQRRCRRHHPTGSERRSAGHDGWRQCGGDAGRTEPGTDRRAPEAASGSTGSGQRNHREAETAASVGGRRSSLPAEPAVDPDRRDAHQEPLPVLCSGPTLMSYTHRRERWKRR